MSGAASGCTRRTALAAALGWVAAARAQEGPAVPAVPYVPTPYAVVEAMLDVARVRDTDLVYDLGCGDGRIVIAAARDRGARGVGIDINPHRIAEARANAARAGVTDRVRFEVADIFDADFSQATVVMLYLLPEINRRLRPQLWRQLQAGTRVVSHAFMMGEDWPPQRQTRASTSSIYMWTITAANKAAARRAR